MWLLFIYYYLFIIYYIFCFHSITLDLSPYSLSSDEHVITYLELWPSLLLSSWQSVECVCMGVWKCNVNVNVLMVFNVTISYCTESLSLCPFYTLLLVFIRIPGIFIGFGRQTSCELIELLQEANQVTLEDTRNGLHIPAWHQPIGFLRVINVE